MIEHTETGKPASDENIKFACTQLNIADSGWLVEFWKAHDGATLNDRILIYSTKDIVERNQTYQVNINFPEYILVGDDSGGGLIIIPKTGVNRFYFIDAGAPFIDDAEMYESLESLIDNVIEDEGPDLDVGIIVSTCQVKAKPSEVLKIKKELGLDFSIQVLAEKLETENCIIMKNVNINKYRDVLASHAHLIKFIN